MDQIEDPHNLGAIVRSAECAGADGIIIPEHKSAPVTPAALKASAGAFEWIPFAVVTNLSRSLEQVKEAGFWTYAAVADAKAGLYETEFAAKTALVIGSEGKGIRPLVQKNCDFEVSVPQSGRIESLNASVSAAVMIYEWVRQGGKTAKA
jgi:23S rRNA (guanosine2251-2'-O)-methyltransferase